VLDPGHGGTDPGAIGVGGNQEKDITLDIAHRAASLLSAQGLAVTLTRDDDRAVSLEERTGRANAAAADLFISIHCNASESHERHGIETYLLDTTDSAIAGRVASRENATSQAASAELGNILSSMRMADQATRSARFARLVQRSAVDGVRFDYPGILDGGVHHAGFYVLVGARMPGVLFESSYLSNPHEETLLTSDDYRQRLAEALADAVARYRSGE
jgi:N-acetylmuramoyl-L-alanine amidase